MTLYSPNTDPKYQHDGIPFPPEPSADIVVSPDTLRDNRLPQGQHRTPKWPVLHATTVPKIDPESWTLCIDGLVQQPLRFTLPEFQKLPRVKVFADFHCVTTWSRLGNLWEGVSLTHLLEMAVVRQEARFAIAAASDGDWTTNIPLWAANEADVLLADTHDQLPIDADHGGPVRLVVPRLFAWKSAKWVKRITLVAEDKRGYWEQLGYHDTGDPWKGQRLNPEDHN